MFLSASPSLPALVTALSLGGASLFPIASLAAHHDASGKEATDSGAIPELDLSPQQSLVVSSPDTANWVLSYPAVLPLVPPANAPWAGAVREPVSRGSLAESVLFLEGVPVSQQDADWHVFRANLLLRIGLVGEAEESLHKALQLTPEHARGLALASVIASVQGDRERAEELALHATRADATSSTAWLALSYTQQSRGNLSEALASTRRAQSVEPDNATGWIRETELQLAADRRKPAGAAADKALALEPDSAIAHTMRALVALLDDQPDMARRGFERATRLDPVDANARFGLSLAHIRQGDLAKARDELLIAVERAPGNGLFHAYLGRVYLSQGEMEKARAELELAKRLDPNNPSAWQISGQMQYQNNRPVSALLDAQTATRLNEGRKVYRTKDLLSDDQMHNRIDLSRAYQALGFSELALNAAQEAVQAGMDRSVANRNLADAYAVMTYGTQARRSLALQSLFDAPMGQLPMALDVVQGVGSAATVPTHNLPAGLEPRMSGLNEYTALFAPSGWQYALDGNVAGYGTGGEQIRLGGRAGPLGIGFAQNIQRSDGVDGKLLDNATWQTLLQARFTPNLNGFLEYRHATSLHDEATMPYDPILASPIDVDERVRVARLGLAWHPGERHRVRVLLARQWRNLRNSYDDPIVGAFSFQTPIASADMPEAQYQFFGEHHSLTLGVSRLDETSNNRYRYNLLPFLDSDFMSRLRAQSVYGYGTWHPAQDFSLTLGLSHVNFRLDSQATYAYSRTQPKFGMNWRPTPATGLHLFTTEASALPKTGGAGLEPVEMAGQQQWHGEENGTIHQIVGASWDQRLTSSLTLWLEGSHDRLLVPGASVPGPGILLDPQYERHYKAALFWQVSPEWLAGWQGGLRASYDRLYQDRPNNITDNNGLRRQIAGHWSLGAQLSGPRGLGINFALTRVNGRQTILEYSTTSLTDYREHYWNTDLALTWKLDHGSTELSLGVRNAFDQDIGLYLEADSLLPRFSPNRFVYARLQWRMD